MPETPFVQPLIGKAAPDQACSKWKVLGALALVGMSCVFLWSGRNQVDLESAMNMASLYKPIVQPARQPMQIPGASRAWHSMQPARAWHSILQTPSLRSSTQIVRSSAEKDPRSEIKEWVPQFQGDLKQKWETMKAAGTVAVYNVISLRPIDKDSVDVPTGTLGQIMGDVIRWSDGSFSEKIVTGVDYEGFVGEPDARLTKLGSECSQEDMAKATSDISGMKQGDAVAIQGNDGKWIYARAVFVSGRDGKTEGLTFAVSIDKNKPTSFDVTQTGDTVKFFRNEGAYSKVKQFREPRTMEDSDTMVSRMNYLYDKLGEQVPDEDLQKASGDLSGMIVGDVVALLRSDGMWTYAKAEKLGGSSKSGTASGLTLVFQCDPANLAVTKTVDGVDWDKNVKQLKTPEAGKGILEEFPLKDLRTSVAGKMMEEATNPLMAKLGQECSEEDMGNTSDDLSDVISGNVVCLLGDDGKWRYSRVLERSGAGKGVALKLRYQPKGTSEQKKINPDIGTKKLPSSEWAGKVKSFKMP